MCKEDKCQKVKELQEENTSLKLENKAFKEKFRVLEDKNKTLEARMEALEKELEKYKKPPKNSNNSSIPPSQDPYRKPYPKSEKSGKKSGGQKGHKGITRMLSNELDDEIPLYPMECPYCGGVDFVYDEDKIKEKRQVVDIPKVEPTITEYQQKTGTCTHCGKKSLGKFPKDVNATVQIGPVAEGVIGYLKVKHHIGFRRIVMLLKDLFGLSISQGTVKNKLESLKTKLKSEYDNILEALKSGNIIGSDTTGMRIECKNAQLWTFQNELYTYLKSEFSKAFKVIEEIIGKTFDGCWVSDRDPTQLKIDANHQICLPHLVRNCQYPIDAENSEWAKRLQQLLKDSMKFRKNREDQFNPLNPDDFREIQNLKRKLTEIFQKPPPKEEERKLFNGLNGRQDQIFMFLNDPKIPYDNNGSERALRNSVIHRKVIGGFRTPEGAQCYNVIASIIETANKQNKRILDEILRIVKNNQFLLST